MQVFLADLDTVDRAEPRRGLRRARGARPRGARPRRLRQRLGRPLARGRPALRRPAMAGARRARARASMPRAARQAFEAEHQRLFGHIQPGGRIDITALRVVGRGLLDWTPPAARSPQASAPKPRETAQGLDRSRPWLARRAGLRRRRSAAGLHARRPAADRGAHHHRLRRPARSARSRRRATTSWSMSEPSHEPEPRSRHPGAGAEPARPHLAPDGLGDDAHGALADLQPEPRLLLLPRRRARHPDQPGRRHPDPYRRRRLRRARHPARLQGRRSSRKTSSC